MSALSRQKRIWFVPLLIALTLIVTWQIALAQAPEPNPLPNVKGVDLTVNGAAASMHGDPLSGRQIFAANCATCHGDLAATGEDNPGSDDGTVPVLNPASEFLDASGGDPDAFAKSIDLFIQHGSRPEGDDPMMLMPAWGDKKLLTQSQMADVEAYVMQLNGLYWPDKWYPPAEVQMSAVRGGNTVTYTISIVNHGGSDLTDVVLRDTLPDGLAYIQSEYFGLGNNPAQVEGSTVQWQVGSVARATSSAPFTIVTGLTGSTVPPNLAQVLFTFCTFDGTCLPASQVSDMVVPGK